MDSLPDDVIDEVVRLTRLARSSVDSDESEAYLSKRDSLLAPHGYVPRVHEEDDGDRLVCYPSEWVENGVVQFERIMDLDRAINRPLDPNQDDEDWEEINTHNRSIVRAVEREYGNIHGANAGAFSDFLGNHYKRRIEDATRRMINEFLTEYFPRNAWPTPQQTEVIEDSLKLVYKTAETPYPGSGMESCQ